MFEHGSGCLLDRELIVHHECLHLTTDDHAFHADLAARKIALDQHHPERVEVHYDSGSGLDCVGRHTELVVVGARKRLGCATPVCPHFAIIVASIDETRSDTCERF